MLGPPRLVSKFSLLLGAAAIMVLPAAAADVDVASVQDTVRLSFAWPDNLTGTVTYTVRKTKISGDRSRNLELSGSYRLRTSAVEDGLMVKTDNVELKVGTGTASYGPGSKLQQFLFRAASTPPHFVVARTGQFLRLEGLDAFRDRLRAAAAEMVQDMPDEAKLKVFRAMAPMMSKAQLESNIVSSWNRDVGAWLGAALDKGEEYELTFSNNIPMFGNLAVPMVSRFRFIDRVPCRDGDAGKKCVDLETRTDVDSAGLNKALEEFIKGLGGGAQVPHIEKFELTTIVRLITEPDTLIPHRVKTTKVSQSVISQGGMRRSAQQVEEVQMVYSY